MIYPTNFKKNLEDFIRKEFKISNEILIIGIEISCQLEGHPMVELKLQKLGDEK